MATDRHDTSAAPERVQPRSWPWWLRRMRRLWWWKAKLYWPTLRAWHRYRWGVAVPPSIMARTGRGKYVDVIRRGPYVEITEHASGEMIRMIPYQDNHGYMVELHTPDGQMPWRTHFDFGKLRKMGFGEGERGD